MHDLQTRIEDLTARALAGEHGPAFVQRIEDVLAQGYAHALQLDAERGRLDSQMDELAGSLTDHEAVWRLRRLGVEMRTLDGHATELRARLNGLREHFVALGGTNVGP